MQEKSYIDNTGQKVVECPYCFATNNLYKDTYYVGEEVICFSCRKTFVISNIDSTTRDITAKPKEEDLLIKAAKDQVKP